MTKLAALILAVLSFTACAAAADSKTASYKSGDENVQGLLYTPSGNGPFPAIIVIHEYFGLNKTG
jgi:carboxymethylenebutenolidase